MASISATEFKALIDDDDITATNAEYILNLAVDVLSLFSDADIANMSGTAGSKTWGGTSKQKGAIYLVARAIYQSFYKRGESTSAGGLSFSSGDVLGNPTILSTIQMAARRIAEFDVSYG